MKKTNEKKNSKGITLVSLVVTIALMLIIISTTGYVSFERFKINKFNKMKTDIELLSDKVKNYYLLNNEIPVIKDDDNNPIEYTYTTLNLNDSSENIKNFYIINLSAMEDLSLNYGKEGFENINKSDDVYIIDELSHVIYYARGMELNGTIYFTIDNNNSSIEDNLPPTTPEIKIIEGELDVDNELNDENNFYYTTPVSVEFIPGKDNWSGVKETNYKINDNEEKNITELENNILNISENGDYNIVLITRDNKENESTKAINIHIIDKEVIDEEVINEEVIDE